MATSPSNADVGKTTRISRRRCTHSRAPRAASDSKWLAFPGLELKRLEPKSLRLKPFQLQTRESVCVCVEGRPAELSSSCYTPKASHGPERGSGWALAVWISTNNVTGTEFRRARVQGPEPVAPMFVPRIPEPLADIPSRVSSRSRASQQSDLENLLETIRRFPKHPQGPMCLTRRSPPRRGRHRRRGRTAQTRPPTTIG